MTTKTLPKIDGVYWALVISSTTLGETAGDLISQTLGLGYGGGTIVLLALFAAAAIAEITVRRSVAWLYWTTLTLASIGGTTLADFAARTLGLGYPVSTALVALSLVATLAAWKAWNRSTDLRAALSPVGEGMYWLAILSSSTLGTAIGDLLSKAELNLDGLSLSDTAFGEWMSAHHVPLAGMGIGDGATAAVLVAGLVVATCVALFTRVSRVGCYWTGIVVTHPLGAALGDFMTKEEGLGLGNTWSSLILAVVLAIVGVSAWKLASRQKRESTAAS